MSNGFGKRSDHTIVMASFIIISLVNMNCERFQSMPQKLKSRVTSIPDKLSNSDIVSEYEEQFGQQF